MEILTKNSDVQRLAARILCGVATLEELSAAKSEDVFAIKTDTSAIHVRGFAAPVIKADETSRTRRFVASDETADRMGDVIRVAGWKFTEFEKNPVALWGHNSDDFPIGRVHDWSQEKQTGRPVLMESITYFSESANPMSEAVLRMIDEGGLRAVSVGFVPTRAYKPKNEAERKELGLGPYGVLYEEQQQLELSNCSIPANPNALLSKSAKKKDPIAKALEDLVKAGKLTRTMADELLQRVAGSVPERRTFALGAVEKLEQDELDAVYSSWRDAVNMSASELKAWDANECSRKASVDADAVIKRNLELLETPKDKWDRRLVDNAKRTVSFVARMKNMEQGEPVSEACPISKRDISLKNWAYDPMKKSTKSDVAEQTAATDPLQECVSSKIPKLIDEHPEWKIDQVVAVAYSMCREGTASADKSCVSCGCPTTKAAPDELKVGDFVMWESSGGEACGEIVDIETAGKIEVPNSDFSVEGTTEDPAAMIKIYEKEEDGSYSETDVFVAHKFSTLRKVEIEVSSEEEEMGYDMQGEMEDESEQVMALRALTDAITALDKRFRALNDSIEALEKRMDEASIAKALEVEKNKTAALRSSGREDAAAFFAQVAERVARSL